MATIPSRRFFEFDDQVEDPITTAVSKLLADNIRMLEEFPTIEGQLKEIESTNELDNKELDDLLSYVSQCEDDIKTLLQEICSGQQVVNNLIKDRQLTRPDFLNRSEIIVASASCSLSECTKFLEYVQNTKPVDASYQVDLDVYDDQLAFEEMEIAQWNHVVKEERRERRKSILELVIDESTMGEADFHKYKTVSKLHVDSPKLPKLPALEPIRRSPQVIQTSDEETEVEEIVEEIVLKERPIWMSPMIYQYSTSSVAFTEKVNCPGCNKQFKGRITRGTVFPELDFIIHCVELCPQFKETGGILSCFKCGYKFISSTEFELHKYASHSKTPSQPKWMTDKVYEESHIFFKPNAVLECPGCSLEFQVQKKGRQTIPSFHLNIHSVENCQRSEEQKLVRSCARCKKKFMRDYGFNAHIRNHCDSKWKRNS